MKTLPQTFVVVDPPAVPPMTEAVEQLRHLLDAVASGGVPGPNYGAGELQHFCQSAVSNQRGTLGRTVAGSWSVAAHDTGMPADARNDFIFTPTYIVVAILTKVLQDFPNIAAAIQGYEEALRRGMMFAALRRLQGHGYDAAEGAADARRILALGQVPVFLASHPDFCPALADLLA